jgi:arsenic resistance protein ArsH
MLFTAVGTTDTDNLPAAAAEHLRLPDRLALQPPMSTHKPRILILYGSLRPRSYSRFLAYEAARLLDFFGCEVRVYDPKDLPLPDAEPSTHPKVQELRELSKWSGGRSGSRPSGKAR